MMFFDLFDADFVVTLTKVTERGVRIRALGNAVVPQQGAHAITTALRPAQVGLFGAA